MNEREADILRKLLEVAKRADHDNGVYANGQSEGDHYAGIAIDAAEALLREAKPGAGVATVRQGLHIIQLPVNGATLLLTRTGTDRVSLDTTLPPSCPAVDAGLPLCLKFDCARDTGAAYLASNFPGLPVTTISSRLSTTPYARPRRD